MLSFGDVVTHQFVSRGVVNYLPAGLCWRKIICFSHFITFTDINTQPVGVCFNGKEDHNRYDRGCGTSSERGIHGPQLSKSVNRNYIYNYILPHTYENECNDWRFLNKVPFNSLTVAPYSWYVKSTFSKHILMINILSRFLRNCPRVKAEAHQWWNNPVPWPMLTCFYETTWRHHLAYQLWYLHLWNWHNK